MKIIKYHIIPIIIISIACLQLLKVNANLTRWKGGGFGMYSEHHFFDYEIWINKSDEDLEKKELKDLIIKLKQQPNDKNAIKLIKKLNLEEDTTLLQVWKPKIEIPQLKYRRQLIYEITYINNIRK